MVDFLINDLIGAASPSQAQGKIPTVDQVLAQADRNIAQRFAAKGYAVFFVHYFDCTRVGPKEAAELRSEWRSSTRAASGSWCSSPLLSNGMDGIPKSGLEWRRWARRPLSR